MRFLVVGASGFVGNRLYRHFLSEGCRTIGTRHSSTDGELRPFDLIKQGLGDFLEPDFLETDEPVFGVLCSALSQIDDCRTKRDLSYEINVTHTLKILHEMKERGIIPVFLSTSFVFDGKEGGYKEDSPHSPISEYGRHKSEVELRLKKDDPAAFIARIDKVLGTDPDENHLFSEWERAARENKPIVCIAEQHFSPTLASDIARSVFQACQLGLKGVYNIANPETFDRSDLARRFIDTAGLHAEVVSKPQAEFGFADLRPIRTTLDSALFRERTGIEFTTMKSAMRFYLDASKRALP